MNNNEMYDNRQHAVSSYIDNHDQAKRPRLILVSDQDCPYYPTEDEESSGGRARIVQLRYWPGDERLAAMIAKWEHKDDPKKWFAIPDEDRKLYIPIRMCKAPISKGVIIVY